MTRKIFAALTGLFLVLGGLGTAAWLAGSAEAQGTAAAASLTITPGARADAMGRAHAAVVSDATANWWNPAALALVDGHVFSLMHTKLVPGLAEDVYYEYLGYAQHLEGWGGIGGHVLFLTYGESPWIDDDGQQLGTFSSYEVSPAISAGVHLTSDLYAGVALKFVYVYLAPDEAVEGEGDGQGDTFAADLALLYQPSGLPVTLAGVLQNLGPDIVFSSSENKNPIAKNIRLGIGLYLIENENMGLVTTFDFNQSLVYNDYPFDDQEKPVYHWGAEWAYGGILALRAGYIYDKDGDIIDPTFGFGLAYRALTFEYASAPQAQGLDRVSKFSLNYRF
jgi:hypothetical protein